MRTKGVLGISLLLYIGAYAGAQAAEWRDESPHRVQLVEVDTDVQLEVLDWGGSGRPVVLLAGLGNSAHIFDNLAPRLAEHYQVYGISRRGYGASSTPATGYGANRLGDDVLAVIAQLKIDRPVIAGHSIAGSELSSIGTRHPEQVSGLIYLDAAEEYAYLDPRDGPSNPGQAVQKLLVGLPEFIKKLEALRGATTAPGTFASAADTVLDTDLPRFESELRAARDAAAEVASLMSVAPIPPSPPADSDRASYQAAAAWLQRAQGIVAPPGEFLAGQVFGTDGLLTQKTAPFVPQAIRAGLQAYTGIKGPVLVIAALPTDPGMQFANEEQRQAYMALSAKQRERQLLAFERGVPQARVVRLANANHYLFLTHEAEVLREMRQFIDTLLHSGSGPGEPLQPTLRR